MKLSCFLVLVAMLLSGSACAEDLDFSAVTCKDFLSSKKSDIDAMLFWLEGYYTKENDPPVLHIEKMGVDAKHLADYCSAHTDDGLITAAEAVMPVK